jgi:AraC-like DNA-binding protein
MKTLRLTDFNPPHTAFEIHPMDWIEQERRGQLDGPHRHAYYVVIWVQAGTGTHDVDFQRFPLEPGTCWFLSPGQAHSLRPDTPPTGWVLSFEHDFFCVSEANQEILVNSGLFNNLLDFKPFHLPDDQQTRFAALLAQMQEEFAADQPLRDEMLRGLLKLFLIQASRAFAAQLNGTRETSRTVCLARQFSDLVEGKFRESTRVADYAGWLHVSPTHLNDTVKKVTGQPASEHIKHRVVLEAKRRAFFGHTSAKEIAYELGFDDEAHFSRYFKTNTGQTFSEYRRSIQAQYAG